MKAIFIALITTISLSANASLLIGTIDATTVSALATTISPTVTTLESSGGYNKQVVAKQAPQFIVANALNGEDLAPAELSEQLDIVRTNAPEVAHLSDVDLSLVLLKVQ
jgi:hypothetical protein